MLKRKYFFGVFVILSRQYFKKNFPKTGGSRSNKVKWVIGFKKNQNFLP